MLKTWFAIGAVVPAVDLVVVAFCDLDVMVVAEADFVFVVAVNRNIIIISVS